ncbi:bile acid:sodium symporter family protein [Amycolatopsis tolypomycina]|uniref:Bile acid:Na+ symporter, BASS family n=1 Tax=Amycolatopsis tolypomycina TaxID=208445 RepID=A0A1H4VG74_9PSEU|nr:bile acid:sodium symporter family protein [Amycolatopsis tolypomycina]SEC79966.1 bile acid:Na+ symporter, BASS family [Amycolatopsis tolypomycina]
MGAQIVSIFLPAALALVMFGLGLSLTPADFARVVKYPKAAVIALTCQIVVLPAICYGLVVLFGLNGVLAVGMMLLVASPGGTSANLFSHLAGGDVALNVTLTAVNSVLAMFTLPVVVAWSLAQFMAGDASIGLQPAKLLQMFAVVLVPVAIGMAVRHRSLAWTEKMQKPVKIASVVVLVLAVTFSIVGNFRLLLDNADTLGPVALLLSVLSLAVGYGVPRLLRVERRQAIASAMEIGIHNAALAITLAMSVLGSEPMAVPAGIYGSVMFVPAAIAAYALSRKGSRVVSVTGA